MATSAEAHRGKTLLGKVKSSKTVMAMANVRHTPRGEGRSADDREARQQRALRLRDAGVGDAGVGEEEVQEPLRQQHGIDPAQQGAQDDARRQDPTRDLRAQGPQGHGPLGHEAQEQRAQKPKLWENPGVIFQEILVKDL